MLFQNKKHKTVSLKKRDGFFVDFFPPRIHELIFIIIREFVAEIYIQNYIEKFILNTIVTLREVEGRSNWSVGFDFPQGDNSIRYYSLTISIFLRISFPNASTIVM